MNRDRLRRLLLGGVGILLFLILWKLISLPYRATEMPPPEAMPGTFVQLAAEGELWRNIGSSLGRFGAGFLLALAAALPLGIITGRWKPVAEMLNPVIQLLRPISPVAWLPLAVLWFGIGDVPAVFIIFVAAFFPIFVSTAAAVYSVPEKLLEVGEVFELTPLQTVRRIVLPAALPAIMVGCRIAIGAGWMNLVVGEMLGAQSGLGFLIQDSRNAMRMNNVVAAMLLIGAIGLAADGAARYFEKRVNRQRH